MDSGTALVIILVLLVWGVLNLILFVKIWKMTDDVKRLADKFAPRDPTTKAEDDSMNKDPFKGSPLFTKD